MNVIAQLNYSHGYFVRFPHTGADLIAHLLFVIVIHTRLQVKHEIKNNNVTSVTLSTHVTSKLTSLSLEPHNVMFIHNAAVLHFDT